MKTTISFRDFWNLQRLRESIKDKGIYAGSGTIISSGGIILTANHVVEKSTNIFVVNQLKLFPAKLVKSLPGSDVAILKILDSKKDFEYCHVSEKPRYPLGLQIFNISFPQIKSQGFDPKLTESYISCERAPFSPSYFQIEAEMSPGSSGSTILNRKGEIIGLVSCRLFDKEESDDTAHNVTYAVKSDSFYKSVRPYLPKLSSPSQSRPLGAAKAASVMVFSSPSN